MHRILSRALLTLCLIWIGGCVKHFAQPDLNQPHAVAKLRIVYHENPGTNLAEQVRFNEFQIKTPTIGTLKAPRAWAVRVPPGRGLWRFSSWFSHTLRTLERRPHQVSEQYPCGTQQAGFGSSQYTTTRYCTRYKTEYRDEWVTHTVNDGGCKAQVNLVAQAGQTYLLQFDFYRPGQCQLHCLIQRAQPDGSFQLAPCAG